MHPLLFVGFFLGLCSSLIAAPKPNVLFFLADDWGRYASCYRDPARPSVNDVIKTPNIDRVAREGVLFRQAYMGVSSCGPSRASIATGCYFWRCGKKAFLQPDPTWTASIAPDPGASLPLAGDALRQAGYAITSSGKTLKLESLRNQNIPLGGDSLRFSLYAKKRQLSRDQTAKVFEQALRSMMKKVLAGRASDQPFFHTVGPVGPHREFARGSGKSLWGIEPDALKGKLPAFIPDEPECRLDWSDTLGEVLALDLEVGILLDELDKAGELHNTMIVLTGDNGANMPRGKAHCYDLGVRAPLMIRWAAGIPTPGRVIDDFVPQIDLAPTWLDAAGLTPSAMMDGRSLLPLLKSSKSGVIDPTRDHVVVGRERHETSARPDNSLYPMRAIRTADHLYIRNFKPERWPSGDAYTDAGPTGDPAPQGSLVVAWLVKHRDQPTIKPLYDLMYAKRPAEELYDLHSDPDQMHNIASAPSVSKVKAALSSKLMSILEKTQDPRLTDAFDKPPYVISALPLPSKKPKAKRQAQ